MNTPYLDKEIEILEGNKIKGLTSFYENGKLKEYQKIKKYFKSNKFR